MASHSLNIKATLDTSSLQSQLDSLNNRKAGQAGPGGNSTAGFVQLTSALNRLNTSLVRLEQAIKGGTSAKGPISQSGTTAAVGNSALLAMLGGKGLLSRKIKAEEQQYVAKMHHLQVEARTAILEQAQERFNKGLPRVLRLKQGSAENNAILLNLPMNFDLKQQFFLSKVNENAYNLQLMRALSEYAAQQRQLREQRWHRAAQGLALTGHFATMLGGSLQDAGYQKTGAAFNILGGTAGGAAAGSAFGPAGTVIGGAIGFVTSLASECLKLAQSAEEAAKHISEMRLKIADSLQSHVIKRTNEEVSEETEKLLENYEDNPNRENLEAIYDARNKALRKKLQLFHRREGAYSEMWEAKEEYDKNPTSANAKKYSNAEREYNIQEGFYLSYNSQFKTLEAKRKQIEKDKKNKEEAERKKKEEEKKRKQEDAAEAKRQGAELQTDYNLSFLQAALANNLEANPYLKNSLNRAEWIGKKQGSWKMMMELKNLIAEAKSTDELKELLKKMTRALSEFNFASNILKLTRPEQVLQQVQGLQGLTGLASIGGNLGEKYLSDELLSRLQTFTEQLYQIIENTAKEESVTFS